MYKCVTFSVFFLESGEFLGEWVVCFRQEFLKDFRGKFGWVVQYLLSNGSRRSVGEKYELYTLFLVIRLHWYCCRTMFM